MGKFDLLPLLKNSVKLVKLQYSNVLVNNLSLGFFPEIWKNGRYFGMGMNLLTVT